MTASDLKWEVENAGHETYFFTRSTMKFFGDTMSNYGCRKTVIDTRKEKDVEVYELHRKRPVKHGLQSSTYFRRDNFKVARAI